MVTTRDAAPSPTPDKGEAEGNEPQVESVPIRFAVIGDYGLAGDAEKDVADLVKSWQPDFVITTGDNNYPNGEESTIDENIGQYYADYIYPYRGSYPSAATENRFFPSLGNHDWNTPDLTPYHDYFELPGNERYYDLIWGPVHLFAVDSDSREPDGVSKGSVQANWLQAALESSDAPWKLVYMHHAPYSSATHGSIDWMQWPFKEWGATAILAGHDHVYERLLVDGLPYFVNGLGGNPGRYVFLIPLPGSQVRYRADHGAMLVEASNSQITFQFYTRAGEMIDSYVINAQKVYLPSLRNKVKKGPSDAYVSKAARLTAITVESP